MIILSGTIDWGGGGIVFSPMPQVLIDIDYPFRYSGGEGGIVFSPMPQVLIDSDYPFRYI